jgi:hypothetical protein
MAASHQHLF